MKDSAHFFETDNKELYEQVRQLKLKLIQAEIDLEMVKFKNNEERFESQENEDSFKQLLELQV